MQARIDAVAASAPAPLRPVESIQTQRQAQEEHAGLAREREPAASFSPRPDPGVNTYTPPVIAHSFVTPDPVAPALAEALAAEPWGHPMPQKAMWEQAAAARERKAQAEPVRGRGDRRGRIRDASGSGRRVGAGGDAARHDRGRPCHGGRRNRRAGVTGVADLPAEGQVGHAQRGSRPGAGPLRARAACALADVYRRPV